MRVVVITGASVGIGLETARRLMLRRDVHLVLTARPSSMERFAELGIREGERVWLRPLDVTDRNARSQVVDEVVSRLGGVDVLVNNAGFAFRAVMEDVCEADILSQMQTNFWAPMELARLCLPAMRDRRAGTIINVSSVGGMMAMPTMGVYSASKFALEGASEALWYEVRPWNIRVCNVQPGFLRSDGFEKVRFTARGIATLSEPKRPYHAHYAFMASFVSRLMRRAWATPESVARTIEWAMDHPDPPLRVAGSPEARVFALARRLLPRRLYHRLLYACLPGVRWWGPRTVLSALEVRPHVR